MRGYIVSLSVFTAGVLPMTFCIFLTKTKLNKTLNYLANTRHEKEFMIKIIIIIMIIIISIIIIDSIIYHYSYSVLSKSLMHLTI